MATRERLICQADALLDGGRGVRFSIEEWGRPATGFVIRYRGVVHAYVNRCQHVPTELDWNEGEFFDYSKLYLICATHGALYEPESGFCIAGPCTGKRLKPLRIVEREGGIYLLEENCGTSIEQPE